MSAEKQRPAVDSRCFDLAETFLDDLPGATADDIWALAKLIQDACEDACREVDDRWNHRGFVPLPGGPT